MNGRERCCGFITARPPGAKSGAVMRRSRKPFRGSGNASAGFGCHTRRRRSRALQAFLWLRFGWTPIFENDQIVFYQMNGFVLGTFLLAALEKEMVRSNLNRPGAFALAHNVAREADAAPLIDRLAKAGGTVLRPASAPPHGGLRGYVADPDDHAWEIAWNPVWSIDGEGRVTFAV